MKILHTADWHIGKKLAGFELLADQEAVFEHLVAVAKKEQVDAIIIAGDLYDRAMPSEAATAVVNRMLLRLNRELGYPLLVVSGNHDSAVRLNTGRDWYQSTQLYLNTRLDQAFSPVTLGDTQFFLLPYFEPVMARQYFDDDSLTNIAKAMVPVIAKMQTMFAADKKHVLVGHFFAAGSEHSDSETRVNVGGLDAVAVSDLTPFDYVALGHLHNRHALKAEKIQYSGALLKYSVSEVAQAKGVYILDTQTMTRKFMALAPKYEVQHLTDRFAHLADPDYYQSLDREAYTAITLTDTQVIPNVMASLRAIFPRVISLDRAHGVRLAKTPQVQAAKLGPLPLLADFYQVTTGTALTAQQKTWAKQALAASQQEV
ncbi:exonuclease SbcCD subunit D [Lacticaseibacillus baoqingensis]|uniref:Nuclease SbcCD subunit D n=1 Tax=Lacticaseibacillus baoqingensis TaxID=2486013 RepID=A0ABW4E669_9LACO|nr:exonuclease SbcCD subunit D [Lacticaseibacillus baoqingensis]